MVMLNLPKKVYFKNGCTPVALRELSEIYHCKRAFLVSDVTLKKLGIVAQMGRLLKSKGIRTTEFFSLQGIPTLEQIKSAVPQMLEFEPDAILGIGGGSALSAAKILWAINENPDLDVSAALKKPELIAAGHKAKLVLAATSFGSGMQNSPFALLQKKKGKVVALNSWNLLPEISITDAFYTTSLPSEQVKADSKKIMRLAKAALAKSSCGDYPHGLLQEAVERVKAEKTLAHKGNPSALEALHNGAALVGAAAGNVLTTAEYLASL